MLNTFFEFTEMSLWIDAVITKAMTLDEKQRSSFKNVNIN